MRSGGPTRAPAWIVVPRRASALASTAAISGSGPIGSTPTGSASSSVVCDPTSVNTDANSQPITPPPITATRSGSWSLRVLWSEVTIRSPSGSKPGIERGAEPVARITLSAETSWPSTATTPGRTSRPWPLTIATLRRLSSPESPPTSLSTTPVVRVATRAQSGVKPPSPLGMMPKSAACSAVRSTSAVCSSALAGMQPRLRQVPPTLSRSTNATDRPADAPYSAAAYPPGPPPTTTRS